MKVRVVLFLSVGSSAMLALSAALLAGQRGADLKVGAKVQSPDIIAIRVRHDLCPLCKIVDPKFPEIIGQKTDAAVLHVTLDLSNETTQRQAALLVGALGLEQFWTGDMSKMGSVTFIDAKKKKSLGFVQTDDVKKISAALRRAVKKWR